MALNACELEIDLMCKGLRLAPDADLHDARAIARTRAGLGSGLELVIPSHSWLKDRLWVNVPIEEAFAARSPYELAGAPNGGFHVTDTRTRETYVVELPRPPRWYDAHTSSGLPMTRVGVLQGTYLGIYLNLVCTFWNYSPPLNCRFCTTGQNVGVNEAKDKAIDDVVETCLAAKAEGATFVHFNSGFQGSRGIAFAEPYVEAVKKHVGMLVGLQLTPERDFSHYDRLFDLGVDHLSFCVEVLDAKAFAEVCPGKARMLGQDLFFDAMAYCAKHLPRGAVSGEIIAGLEPVESTLAAIDLIADLGAFPTVCIFRPTAGSDLAETPPPAYDDMRRVMAHVYDTCRRHWLPIGVAPNIEVSLIVNPDDAALLATRGPAFYAYEAWRRAVRFAARPIFRRRMRPAA
ncbi:MAG: radical SAM protein [Vicinamibacterales bacterium]